MPDPAVSKDLPPRRRRRSDSAARRDAAILSAARARFAGEGFDAASIADIARDAGVAVGTVYLRYSDKGALLAAVLEEAAGDFVAAMERPDIHARPWAERLEPMFAALLAEAARHPDLPALMRLSMQLPHDPGHLKVRAAIEHFMSGGQAAGAFRQVPVGPAAAIAHGMVQAAMREAMAGQTPPEVLAGLLADAARRWMVVDRI